MRIQKSPESVNFDKTILWQYSNAERLKKLVGLFNSMIEYCALRPWRLLTKSLNLGEGGYEYWDNKALKNNKAGKGNAIQFRPSFFGMKSGDALRSIAVTTTDTRNNVEYGFIPGKFRIKIKTSLYAADYIAISDSAIVPEVTGWNYPTKFVLSGKEKALDPDTIYYIVFERDTNYVDGEVHPENWVSSNFNVSLYVNSAQNFSGLCYILNTPRTTWQPIIEFEWLDLEMKEAEERTLSLISTMFGIPNPGYYPGSEEGISIDLWRRYIQSQIFLMDSNGSVKDLNDWMKTIMPNTVCKIHDNRNMTISYQFTSAIDEKDRQLIEVPGFFHAPAGVKVIDATGVEDIKFGLVENAGQTRIANIGALNEGRFADTDQNGEADATYNPPS